MKVRDIEALRRAIRDNCPMDLARLLDMKCELYEAVLDAIAKGGTYPAAAQAMAALGRPIKRTSDVKKAEMRTERCRGQR